MYLRLKTFFAELVHANHLSRNPYRIAPHRAKR